MAIGERIRFFRNLKGMTQKFLGVKVGFPEKTADIRLAQYESGTRTPKSDLTEALADALGVSTMALNVPDIDTDLGFMHTLFALEDIYGLKIDKLDDEVCIRLDILYLQIKREGIRFTSFKFHVVKFAAKYKQRCPRGIRQAHTLARFTIRHFLRHIVRKARFQTAVFIKINVQQLV